MKVTTIVVDDEPIARAGLRAMLLAFEWIEVIGEAGDGQSAVDAIEKLKPELVFLDVQMPGIIGTDVLRRIERQPYIIFTTAFAEHAVTAFELGAVDFVNKYLPAGVNWTIELIGCLFGLLLTGAIVWWGAAAAWSSYLSGEYIGSVARVHVFPARVALLAGLIVLFLRLSLQLVEDVQRMRSGGDPASPAPQMH